VRTTRQVSEDSQLSTDLEVTSPRGASIEGRGRYGDFDITDISAESRRQAITPAFG